jgi:intracellular septation protein A
MTQPDAADVAPAAWEPGAPSRDEIVPSLIGGVIVPLIAYFVARSYTSVVNSLMIAGAFPALWVAVQWVRTRRVDIIGTITLFAFVAGVSVSVALGGNAFVLKIRDTAFTIPFGIACLLSINFRRPMMFYIGRSMSAGTDERKLVAYNELWEIPEAQRVFRVITTVWGFGFFVEAGVRMVLAATLPTGLFVVLAPIWAAISFGGLFVFTSRYSRKAREEGEANLAEQGLAFPSVALEADSTL